MMQARFELAPSAYKAEALPIELLLVSSHMMVVLVAPDPRVELGLLVDIQPVLSMK